MPIKKPDHLECIEISPKQEARGSVIWLHGLGADGHDFESIVPQLGLRNDVGLRFIFPHAPIRPVTINNHIPMRAWYDITALNRIAAEDELGIHESQTLLEDLIHKEHARGIPYANIILAGFSQGGAMALHTGLSFPEPLGGIIALSCYLPLQQQFTKRASLANREIAIFMAHGDLDDVLPLLLGKISKQFLESHSYLIEWHTYPIRHGVCIEEIQDIGNWLNGL